MLRARKIIYTAGRESTYTRNEIILRALRTNYEVIEIVNDHPNSIVIRSLQLLPRLTKALLKDDYDLIIVGFYGYFLVPWIRQFTSRPILFDAFVSNYDTLCFDRKYFDPASIFGKLAFRLDQLVCNIANKVLLDTLSHQKFFTETFSLPVRYLDFLYVSCNEDRFFPQPGPTLDTSFRVIYYSSYLPLHGVEHIIFAANLLKDHKDLDFYLIGDGINFDRVHRLAKTLGLTNVRFFPPIPYKQLPSEIAAADLCLGGPFGDTPKARRVIPTKTFQFLAMARPVIASDTPGNRELLAHKQSAFLVPLADPSALASAIIEIRDNQDLRKTLAKGGYECYQQKASEQVIGQKLFSIVENTLGNPQ